MSVIIYQDHIDILEEENSILKREICFLKQQLGYKSYGNLDTKNYEED